MNIIWLCVTIIVCVAVVAIFGSAAQVMIEREKPKEIPIIKAEIEALREEFEDLKLNLDERVVSQQINVQNLEKSVENLARKII